MLRSLLCAHALDASEAEAAAALLVLEQLLRLVGFLRSSKDEGLGAGCFHRGREKARVLDFRRLQRRWSRLDSCALAARTLWEHEETSPTLLAVLLSSPPTRAARNFAFKASRCRVLPLSVRELVLFGQGWAKTVARRPYRVQPQTAVEYLGLTDREEAAAVCPLALATDEAVLWDLDAVLGDYLCFGPQEFRVLVCEHLPQDEI